MGFIYSFATAGGREQCYCSRDLHRLTEYWARTNEAAESSWISHLTTVDNIVDGVWIVRPSPHNSLIAKLGIAAQRVVVSSHWSRIWPQRETSCSFSKDTTLTEMSVVSVGLSRPLSLSILRFSCLSWSVLSSVVSFDRFLQFSSILWLVLFFFFFFCSELSALTRMWWDGFCLWRELLLTSDRWRSTGRFSGIPVTRGERRCCSCLQCGHFQPTAIITDSRWKVK